MQQMIEFPPMSCNYTTTNIATCGTGDIMGPLQAQLIHLIMIIFLLTLNGAGNICLCYSSCYGKSKYDLFYI